MSGKTVDEMRSELEAAGYNISLTDFHVRRESFVATPDGWSFVPDVEIEDWFSVSENEEKAIVEKAWQHYQREKQHSEMKALLERVAALYGVLKYSETQALAEEAKALLESMKTEVE